MIRKPVALATAAAVTLAVTGLLVLPKALRAQPELPHHQVPPAKDGGVVVMLCDGKTSLEVKGLKPGEQLSHDQALAVSQKLMAQWRAKNPSVRWEMAQAERAGGAGAGSKPQIVGGPSGQKYQLQQGDTYASFHDRDFLLWKTETDKFVEEGRQIFHSGKLLGGTIGVSCDMCHPDASNTHPESYPKYQVQLQRVALLRDMINWCIENPVKGKALKPDDEKLRALEAYILAQRKGIVLNYGQH